MVDLTEPLHPADLRGLSCIFTVAKLAELDALVKRGELSLVHRKVVPSDENIHTGRFVLAIGNVDTAAPFHMARFLVLGRRGHDKRTVVNNYSTACPASVHLLVCIAAMRRYALWP